MKLRSIILAGLLGGTLLMTSGCGSDDVKDAIADALKTSVIHVANAHPTETNFIVEGALDGENKIVAKNSSEIFSANGENSYTVSNGDNDSPVDFEKDSAHLYALCANGTVITDSAKGKREIEILNLSGIPLSGNDVTVTLYNESGANIATKTLGKELGACKNEVLTFDSSFNLKDIETVEINDANYTIPGYGSDVTKVLDSLDGVDFDIVVFDESANKGTIIPLATATDLDLL